MVLLKELNGYEVVLEDTWNEDDGMARAKIIFEDAVNTPVVYLKFREDEI